MGKARRKMGSSGKRSFARRSDESIYSSPIFLNNGLDIALSDLRKFAKIELWKTKELEKSLKKLGPDPLTVGFQQFQNILSKKKGKIKQVLMDQAFLAGIGNIYANEILWEAKIAPTREARNIKEEELKNLWLAMRKVLNKDDKAARR